MLERLNTIRDMVDKGYYILASAEIDLMYEEYLDEKIKLNINEEEYMFSLIDKISRYIF